MTPDPLPGEVDPLVRPAAGVVGGTLEAVEPGEVGDVRRRQAAGRHDHELGRTVVPPSSVRTIQPAGRLVEGRVHATLVSNWHVPAQVEPVGHVVRVGEDLGLRRVALGPLPLLLELVGELVRVLHALDVAAGSRVPVPVPRAARRRRRPRTPAP